MQGAEAVRTIVVYIRKLYEYREFNFAGPYGDNGFLEDYTAQIRGEPIGSVVLVTRNAAGQARHIAANYRPRSSLLILSRLLGEKFAGTPYGEHFAASESLNGPMTASTQLQYDVQVSALLPAAGAPLPHEERPHWSPLPGQ